MAEMSRGMEMAESKLPFCILPLQEMADTQVACIPVRCYRSLIQHRGFITAQNIITLQFSRARMMSIMLLALRIVLEEEPTSFVVLPALRPSPGMKFPGTFLFRGRRFSEASKATTTSVDGRSLILESGNIMYDICTCLVIAFCVTTPASDSYAHLLT